MIAGVGIDGDAHAGPTVKDRSPVAMDPSQPNLGQVHLLHEELFAEVTAAGFSVAPGELGEVRVGAPVTLALGTAPGSGGVENRAEPAVDTERSTHAYRRFLAYEAPRV